MTGYTTNALAYADVGTARGTLADAVESVRRSTGAGRADLLAVLEYATERRERPDVVEYCARETAIPAGKADDVVGELVSSDLLVADRERQRSVRLWAEHGWIHSLYYYDVTTGEPPVPVEADRPDEPAGREPAGHEPADREAESTLELPPPDYPEPDAVSDVLEERSTCRDFSGRPMTLEELSGALRPVHEVSAAWRDEGAEPMRRLLADAFDVFVLPSRCDDARPGLYEYLDASHRLALRRELDSGEEIDRLVEDWLYQQPHALDSAVSLVLVVDLDRSRLAYEAERAYRDVFMGLSMHAHRIILAATALGLETFQSAAFDDDAVESFLGVDGYGRAGGYVLALGR